jgi:hypothetical protein
MSLTLFFRTRRLFNVLSEFRYFSEVSLMKYLESLLTATFELFPYSRYYLCVCHIFLSIHKVKENTSIYQIYLGYLWIFVFLMGRLGIHSGFGTSSGF